VAKPVADVTPAAPQGATVPRADVTSPAPMRVEPAPTASITASADQASVDNVEEAPDVVTAATSAVADAEAGAPDVAPPAPSPADAAAAAASGVPVAAIDDVAEPVNPDGVEAATDVLATDTLPATPVALQTIAANAEAEVGAMDPAAGPATAQDPVERPSYTQGELLDVAPASAASESSIEPAPADAASDASRNR
jgi:hypothetical protein